MDLGDPWSALLVLAIALVASLVAVFTGFGLGSILLPAFALLWPLEQAVAATAAVHLCTSATKAVLLRQHAHWGVVARFGVPALLSAFVGAALLLAVPDWELASYELGARHAITPLGLVLGALVVAFAVVDLRAGKADPGHAPAGQPTSSRGLVAAGLGSGFFGGLSGHQGALRSLALQRLRLEPQAFVATGAACAVLVDLARLFVYAGAYRAGAAGLAGSGGWPLVAGAAVVAMLAVALGVRVLPKVTARGLRLGVGVALVGLGCAIAVGLV